MKVNIKNENHKTKFLLKTIVIFILLLAMALTFSNSIWSPFVVSANSVDKTTLEQSLNTDANTEKEYLYLSDIEYDKSKSSTAWKTISYDKNLDGGSLSLMVNGAVTPFEKGILAHAKSTVVYDISAYDYDYFTSYIGVNSSAGSNGNGVKFFIYTSVDGKQWELKTNENPSVLKGSSNAEFIKVDIRGANYIKLYADDNGGNGSDHSEYADAKLIKEGYSDNVVQTVEEYDEIIKTKFANQEEITGEFELVLLQREFVKNVGQYTLKRFLNEKESNKNVLSWLMGDLENLRLYILGGKPDGGNYYNSLNVLAELYTKYKDDFDIPTATRYGTRLGYLYKKMAITLSLTHSIKVALWMDPFSPENQSNAAMRYLLYQKMHIYDKFVVSDRQDHTKWFEALQVEEMRYVFNNIIDDEEILWLNDYTQKFIDQHPGQEETYLQPHRYMKYVYPNYSKPEYHALENRDMWSEKYGNFLNYGVTYKPGVKKLWMNLDNGAVCGGISKIGSNIRAVHGTPSAVIGQPGHAAIIYYRQLEDGRGYWSIDNDIYGWSRSERGERLPLGWGNDSYVKGYNASYIVLAQEAMNDWESYEKSEKFIMLADVYKNDFTKQEQIYRKALSAQSINIDAWYGLINLYQSNATKTEADFYNLAVELTNNIKEFPLPMKNLLALIAPQLTSSQYSFQFTLLETRALTEASQLTSSDKVIQPNITRTVASYLLGQTDSTLANFSFDGENAGKIVLSNRYDGTGIRWDYSLDGKQTWKEISFEANEEHSVLLTEEELESITSQNDIYIHVVGTNYNEENLYKIDILDQNTPTTLYNNDLENKVIGATDVMEWKINENDPWVSFKDQEPDLTGNKTVRVRIGKTGTSLASGEVSLNYTQDVEDESRKYIPISCLSIHSVSSQATNKGRSAANAIDGSIYTSWHSDWNGADNEKYIVIALDKPKYLSSLEYVPLDGKNGKIHNAVISVSMDGETWTEVVSSTNWGYDSTTKRVDFEATNAKYIKLVGAETQSVSTTKSFIAAVMFNLYEDTTKGA